MVDTERKLQESGKEEVTLDSKKIESVVISKGNSARYVILSGDVKMTQVEEFDYFEKCFNIQ